MSRATLYQAKNISRKDYDYDFEGINIGPEWESYVLDTIPLVLMMRQMGVSFRSFQEDMMLSERRDGMSVKTLMVMISCLLSKLVKSFKKQEYL